MKIPKMLHLSATAITNFKACPMRFKNHNHLGIRRIEDTEALRVGTNWHEMLEQSNIDAVVSLLNERYSRIPDGMNIDAVAKERAVLLNAYKGYRWFYTNNPFDVIANEIPFTIRLINPESGRALPNVVVKGKIDKLVRLRNNRIAVGEHKSTSSQIDPDSRYWSHLNLDTQTTLYIYAARRLQQDGLFSEYGIEADDEPITIAVLDAWRKPSIKPKNLTQADSKEFVNSGVYCGQTFDVVGAPIADPELSGSYPVDYYVNGKSAEVTPGKKEGTFAIRETADMFGARYLDTIVNNPDTVFARHELSKSDKQLERFEWELLNIYRTIQEMRRTGHWYTDEHQCEATFICPYTDFCYAGMDLDPENPPAGFKCIFDKGDDDDSNTPTPSR